MALKRGGPRTAARNSGTVVVLSGRPGRARPRCKLPDRYFEPGPRSEYFEPGPRSESWRVGSVHLRVRGAHQGGRGLSGKHVRGRPGTSPDAVDKGSGGKPEPIGEAGPPTSGCGWEPGVGSERQVQGLH